MSLSITSERNVIKWDSKVINIKWKTFTHLKVFLQISSVTGRGVVGLNWRREDGVEVIHKLKIACYRFTEPLIVRYITQVLFALVSQATCCFYCRVDIFIHWLYVCFYSFLPLDLFIAWHDLLSRFLPWIRLF